MNLSLYIAKRYLFSKKSHNAIHIISLVAVCGVTIATLATVCTLSVFNGFQGLVSEMFSAFDPELKITPVKGKVFDPADEKFLEIRSLPEIELISESLEDNVLVRYNERQVPAILKGVSGNFDQLVPIQDILFDGEFKLQNEVNAFANLGIGVASVLGMNANFVFPLEIYAPKRNVKTVNLSNSMTSFNLEYAYISSIFMINQPVYDDNYLLVPIELARTLFDYETEVSAWELKLKDPTAVPVVQKKIQQILGEDYEIKNRYEQQEAAFKMINIEKWVTFLMLCFILLIAAFNVIGSLSMLIVDKQQDITTLRNLGAGNKLISRIFLLEGWMISALGAVMGIVLGVLLCLGQQYFGWIKLGSSGTFAVDAYPVQMATGDLLLTLVAVLVIGFLSVIYPVRYLSKKWLR
ncbi:membrane protein [Bacteroidia bacterium]|nr:membrane protein [Bacteroidia bacterium]GHT50340.1 membrane protein [Bacteroidia bacterium]